MDLDRSQRINVPYWDHDTDQSNIARELLSRVAQITFVQ